MKQLTVSKACVYEDATDGLMLPAGPKDLLGHCFEYQA